LSDVPADREAKLVATHCTIPIAVQGSKQAQAPSSDFGQLLRLGSRLRGHDAWPAKQAENDDESDPGQHGWLPQGRRLDWHMIFLA
jgi:hypothetical protein